MCNIVKTKIKLHLFQSIGFINKRIHFVIFLSKYNNYNNIYNGTYIQM